jgi:hypothetical protein
MVEVVLSYVSKGLSGTNAFDALITTNVARANAIFASPTFNFIIFINVHAF